MPCYQEAFPSKYLAAIDLNGRAVPFRIVSFDRQEVGRNKEMKLILFFANEKKGLIANKTNAKMIAKLYGDEMQKWIGQIIVLYPTPIEFNGEVNDAIRVKAPPLRAKQPAPPPIEADLNDEIPDFDGSPEPPPAEPDDDR